MSGIETKLRAYIDWSQTALPDLQMHRYRRSSELYALLGALDIVSAKGSSLSKVNPSSAGQNLRSFETQTHSKKPTGLAAQYVIAASKHTDDLEPRKIRIEILKSLIG